MTMGEDSQTGYSREPGVAVTRGRVRGDSEGLLNFTIFSGSDTSITGETGGPDSSPKIVEIKPDFEVKP